jgi:hypothetical protein
LKLIQPRPPATDYPSGHRADRAAAARGAPSTRATSASQTSDIRERRPPAHDAGVPGSTGIIEPHITPVTNLPHPVLDAELCHARTADLRHHRRRRGDAERELLVSTDAVRRGGCACSQPGRRGVGAPTSMAQQRKAQRPYDLGQMATERIAKAVGSSPSAVYHYLNVKGQDARRSCVLAADLVVRAGEVLRRGFPEAALLEVGVELLTIEQRFRRSPHAAVACDPRTAGAGGCDRVDW